MSASPSTSVASDSNTKVQMFANCLRPAAKKRRKSARTKRSDTVEECSKPLVGQDERKIPVVQEGPREPDLGRMRKFMQHIVDFRCPVTTRPDRGDTISVDLQLIVDEIYSAWDNGQVDYTEAGSFQVAHDVFVSKKAFWMAHHNHALEEPIDYWNLLTGFCVEKCISETVFARKVAYVYLLYLFYNTQPNTAGGVFKFLKGSDSNHVQPKGKGIRLFPELYFHNRPFSIAVGPQALDLFADIKRKAKSEGLFPEVIVVLKALAPNLLVGLCHGVQRPRLDRHGFILSQETSGKRRAPLQLARSKAMRMPYLHGFSGAAATTVLAPEARPSDDVAIFWDNFKHMEADRVTGETEKNEHVHSDYRENIDLNLAPAEKNPATIPLESRKILNLGALCERVKLYHLERNEVFDRKVNECRLGKVADEVAALLSSDRNYHGIASAPGGAAKKRVKAKAKATKRARSEILGWKAHMEYIAERQQTLSVSNKKQWKSITDATANIEPNRVGIIEIESNSDGKLGSKGAKRKTSLIQVKDEDESLANMNKQPARTSNSRPFSFGDPYAEGATLEIGKHHHAALISLIKKRVDDQTANVLISGYNNARPKQKIKFESVPKTETLWSLSTQRLQKLCVVLGLWDEVLKFHIEYLANLKSCG